MDLLIIVILCGINARNAKKRGRGILGSVFATAGLCFAFIMVFVTIVALMNDIPAVSISDYSTMNTLLAWVEQNVTKVSMAVYLGIAVGGLISFLIYRRVGSDVRGDDRSYQNPDYHGQNYQNPNYPGQNSQNPNYPGQNNQNSYYPGQNNQNPYYPGQNNQNPNYPGQNNQSPNYPGPNYPGQNYPGQNNPNGGYYKQNVPQMNDPAGYASGDANQQYVPYGGQPMADGVQLDPSDPNVLSAPCVICIVRERASEGAGGIYTFSLNGYPACGLANGSCASLLTYLVKNTVTARDSTGTSLKLPITFIAAAGGYVELHVKGGQFLRNKTIGRRPAEQDNTAAERNKTSDPYR